MNRMSIEQIEETTVQQVPDKELHLLDLLIVLSKRRKFIFYFTFGLAILTAIVVLLLPSKYTAETVVLPPEANSSIGSSLLSQLGGSSSALVSIAGAGLGMKNPSEMYVALFRTPVVEDALINRFGLMARYRAKRMSDARKAFENHSTVVLGPKDGLIRITVTDWDPKLSAEMANAYVDGFRNLSAHLAVTEASQRRLFFQQQLLEANENLAMAEEAMKTSEQTTGVLQIDSQARALIEVAANLRAQIGAKEVELQGMRSYATSDNPRMLVAEQELAALKSQLAQLTGKESNSNSDIIVPKGNIPDAQMQYVRKLRDLKYDETVEEILAKQFETAKLDEAREGAIIQVASVATPPDKRSSPKRTISVLVALIVGFLFSCGWCFFKAAIERLKSNPAERERLEALRAAYKKDKRAIRFGEP